VSTSNLILSEYDLCDFCIGRIFKKKLNVISSEILGKKIRKNLRRKPSVKCFICKNILSNSDYFVEKMILASKEFDFSTFVVGTILKPSVVDKDDLIRSKFKLQGIDSIKSNLTYNLSKKFARKTRTKLDYYNPELTLTFDTKTDSCQVNAKPIFFSGTYTKLQRGIPQKEQSCVNCHGKGCTVCQYSGLSTFDSVEGKITKIFYKKCKSQQTKISWIGGEDKTSLVLGKGRPFFIKILCPKKRAFNKQNLRFEEITIHNLKPIKQFPKRTLYFKTKVEIIIETKNSITLKDLRAISKLEKNFIKIHEKNKKSQKYVYSIKPKKTSTNSFILRLKTDGGLPIKRFVEGMNVKPNLTSLLNTKCICKQFDFHDVSLK